MDFTGLVRGRFVRRAERMDAWAERGDSVQAGELRSLLRRGSGTEMGRRIGFGEMAKMSEGEMRRVYGERVPVVGYEDIRGDMERMVRGERDVLWPGRCRYFAQSSGTSGGKSKYVPITEESLRRNHMAGAADVVASYLRLVGDSRLFSGKGLILGGSFANEIGADLPEGVKVGDLSATLIYRTPGLANLFRVPSKRVALMSDWEEKLPAIVREVEDANVTNLSGVPSWFLVLLRRVMEAKGVECLHEVWPNLEVFFHGGIAFGPYRSEYEGFTDKGKMHFLETYNASEGFFAVQTDFGDAAMQLLLDRGVYYEFAPVGKDGNSGQPVGISEVSAGGIYELIISSCNGLWRYSPGDTVRVSAGGAGRVTIAGRTKSFINAFGEELMEHNADAAIAGACRETGAGVLNYSAAPVYASSGKRGHHRWLIEWSKSPSDVQGFASVLDRGLQRVNSDYQAKRSGGIFLDGPEVVSVPSGFFDMWLSRSGSGKLGGQRKVPRLCPTPEVHEGMLELLKSMYPAYR